jgi:hypothetical protein
MICNFITGQNFDEREELLKIQSLLVTKLSAACASYAHAAHKSNISATYTRTTKRRWHLVCVAPRFAVASLVLTHRQRTRKKINRYQTANDQQMKGVKSS